LRLDAVFPGSNIFRQPIYAGLFGVDSRTLLIQCFCARDTRFELG
jgi:hypothetical protein